MNLGNGWLGDLAGRLGIVGDQVVPDANRWLGDLSRRLGIVGQKAMDLPDYRLGDLGGGLGIVGQQVVDGTARRDEVEHRNTWLEQGIRVIF